jgi:polysaccharide export outer membrane protein
MSKYPKNKFFQWATVIFVFSLSFQSCVNYKNQIYFQGLVDTTSKTSMNQPSIVIQPGDQLLIRVFALDEKGAEYFNQPLGLGANPNLGMMGQGGGGMIGYLVNEMGEIDFPKIGKIKVVGLTQEYLRDSIQSWLLPYLKEPIVNVRLLNFRVTYITSTSASTEIITNNKTNLLQFIGMVGGINWLDKRDNIIVIRQVNDVRQVFKVNLTDASVFKSPAFYLQPNDVIYVEPNSRKFLETNVQLLSYVTVITSTVSIFILFINGITN